MPVLLVLCLLLLKTTMPPRSIDTCTFRARCPNSVKSYKQTSNIHWSQPLTPPQSGSLRGSSGHGSVLRLQPPGQLAQKAEQEEEERGISQNECGSLEGFEELPSYPGSQLDPMVRHLTPILYNDTLQGVAR